MQSRPTVVVLAAGKGSRFKGSAHKLEQSLGDLSVLGSTLRNAIESHLPVVVVTTQPLAAAAAQVVAARDVVVVPQALAALGMGHSIAAGIAARADAPGWLLLPGDMPMVRPATLLAVAAALEQHPVAYAQYQGRRGHPVGFAAELYSELMLLDLDTEADLPLGADQRCASRRRGQGLTQARHAALVVQRAVRGDALAQRLRRGRRDLEAGLLGAAAHLGAGQRGDDVALQLRQHGRGVPATATSAAQGCMSTGGPPASRSVGISGWLASRAPRPPPAGAAAAAIRPATLFMPMAVKSTSPTPPREQRAGVLEGHVQHLHVGGAGEGLDRDMAGVAVAQRRVADAARRARAAASSSPMLRNRLCRRPRAGRWRGTAASAAPGRAPGRRAAWHAAAG
jgi:molybdenum cofactor cytidylyltransferase